METAEKENIIVPFDFSTLSYNSLEYAAYMSKAMHCRVMILHVAIADNAVPIVEKKLSFVVEECYEKFGVRPEIVIRTSFRPYWAIRNVSREMEPFFAILKTGGVKGIKRYTGIRTIKILSGSGVPFLVVQKPPVDTVFRNILFPINFLKTHDAKLRRVLFFSKYYPEATMHIMTPSGKGTHREMNISNNLKLLTQVLRDHEVEANFIVHDRKKNTAEDILQFSKKVNADLIVIQMENVPTYSKFLFGLREEKLVTNPDKIPVMCISEGSDFKGLY
jgi:hypothetical protein